MSIVRRASALRSHFPDRFRADNTFFRMTDDLSATTGYDQTNSAVSQVACMSVRDTVTGPPDPEPDSTAGQVPECDPANLTASLPNRSTPGPPSAALSTRSSAAEHSRAGL